MKDYSNGPYKCPEIALMGSPSEEKKRKMTQLDEMF